MKKLLFAGMVVSLASTAALAEDMPSSVNFGLIGGYGLSSAGTTQWQSPHFGARISKLAYSNDKERFFIGAVAETSQSTQVSGSVTGTGTTTAISVDLLGRSLYGSKLFGGGRIGMAMRSFTATSGVDTASYSGTALNVGPVIGYEFKASDKMFIDLEFHWNTVGASVMSGSSGTYASLPVSTLLFSVVLNFIP